MNIIDIVFVIFVAIIAIISANKGFILSLLNIAAYFIAGVLAKIFASPVSEYVYTNYAYEKVMAKLNEILPSGSVEGEINTVIEGVFESLPDFVYDLANHFGVFNTEAISGAIGSTLTVELIEKNYVGPAVCSVISVVVIVFLFILFAILLRIVFAFINKLLTSKKHKIMRKTNMFLGAALGVIKGVIPAGLVCAVLNIAVPAINNAQFTDFVNGSYFCNLVADILK